MFGDYAYVALMAVIAIAFMFIILVLAKIISPKKATAIKNDTYECGLETTGDSWIQFRVQYYLYALIFVIFDVEVIFLLPWAVSYGVLGWFALVQMFVFIGLLLVGLVYAWRKGALEWA